jgi:hypothetical protein
MTAVLLVLTGLVILARCGYQWLAAGTGWQALAPPAGVGFLIVALGVARWRFWRARQTPPSP